MMTIADITLHLTLTGHITGQPLLTATATAATATAAVEADCYAVQGSGGEDRGGYAVVV